MKAGETVPVTIAGQVVAQATVKELGDGTATLVVPATLVVMATRTELTVETPRTSEVETIIMGVDRASGNVEPPATETPAVQPAQSAAVDGVQNNVENVETPSQAPTEQSAENTVEAPSEPASEG
jgi:hypothetical protein